MRLHFQMSTQKLLHGRRAPSWPSPAALRSWRGLSSFFFWTNLYSCCGFGFLTIWWQVSMMIDCHGNHWLSIKMSVTVCSRWFLVIFHFQCDTSLTCHFSDSWEKSHRDIFSFRLIDSGPRSPVVLRELYPPVRSSLGALEVKMIEHVYAGSTQSWFSKTKYATRPHSCSLLRCPMDTDSQGRKTNRTYS